MKHNFIFSTSYNQFYLADKLNQANTDSASFWTDESYNDKLAIAKGILGIGTKSYGNIKGELSVLEQPNKIDDYEKYDHIVEGGILVDSGIIQLLDCPNYSVELELQIKPGKYRVRVYGSNFSSVKEADLTNDSDSDFYKIEIWPDENMERKVLKQYIDE